MKKLLFSLFAVALFSAASLQAQGSEEAKPKEPREFEMEDGDTTIVMRRYIMVFLMRGEKAQEFSKEELEEIQAGHMKNMTMLEEKGKLLVAGPFGDDTEYRGIFIMDCETVEEAEALVASDPAIKAGRLRAECHPWWTMKGAVIK